MPQYIPFFYFNQVLNNFSWVNLSTDNISEQQGLFFHSFELVQIEGLEELHNNIIFYLATILLAIFYSVKILLTISWIILSIILNDLSFTGDIIFRFPSIFEFMTETVIHPQLRHMPLETRNPNRFVNLAIYMDGRRILLVDTNDPTGVYLRSSVILSPHHRQLHTSQDGVYRGLLVNRFSRDFTASRVLTGYFSFRGKDVRVPFNHDRITTGYAPIITDSQGYTFVKFENSQDPRSRMPFS